eukprot:COSAG01_NODE_3679_length_5802_cov_347.111520_1_plen_66_part_00
MMLLRAATFVFMTTLTHGEHREFEFDVRDWCVIKARALASHAADQDLSQPACLMPPLNCTPPLLD